MTNKNQDSLFWSEAETAAGTIVYVRSERGLVSLGFSDAMGESDALADLMAPIDAPMLSLTRESPDPEIVAAFGNWLAGRPYTIDFDFLSGTKFQRNVWLALLEIPRGKTVTYSEVARRVKNSSAVRAVGAAIGSNPISGFIPCHRVLRKDGTMGGYRWGIETKQLLLRSEAAECKVIAAPTRSSAAPTPLTP